MKRNRSKLIVAFTTLFMATMLMACSSTTETVEETKVMEVAEVKETESTPEPTAAPTPAPTAEPTPEPTAEPTPEPIVYEGIDMESTLPGEEWVETFVGIIEEPKFVVFNNETNKKIIVESGQEVEFEEGDTLGAFEPDGRILYNYEGINIKEFRYNELHYYEFIFMEGSEIIPNSISVEVYDYAPIWIDTITCTLKTPTE